MKRIGITGQAGFMGTHLFNHLNLRKKEYTLVPFKDEFFDDEILLKQFVESCDVIVHLAAMNRHKNPQVIYETNLDLVNKLILALESSHGKPHLLFASSTQEEQDNPYGRSKREGRELLANWALKHHAIFTGLVIPNVFGPFGNPYYNSVISTFCYQLTHNESPRIDIDGQLKLIYVGELVQVFLNSIKEERNDKEFKVPHTNEIKVSAILKLLESFKTEYMDKGIFPFLSSRFETNLFNTFRCFMDIERHFPVNLKLNTDDRGSFVETVKSGTSGQTSFSVTKPHITRGNHFHTRKIERFAVIKGEATIELRRIGSDHIMTFVLSGNEPAYVDMPVWYTHNITNTGNDELYTIFWISEFFDPADPDTFFEPVRLAISDR